MIGGANPLASPLLGAPSPGGRRFATTASCVLDPSPPLATAAEPTAQSDSAPPPPRPDAPASPPPPPSSSSPRPLRASSQLSQWSRKRALRSGRRLGLASSASPVTKSSPPPKPPLPTAPPLLYDGAPPAWEDNDDDLCVAVGDASAGKVIYMVSDGTGWTAEHAVNAALGQFELCLVDRDCTVNTHLFSGIDDEDRLLEVIKQAAKEGALVLYTLADPSMAESAKKACDFWSVPYTDLLGPTVDAIASHIGVAPSGIPRSSPSRQGGHLTEDYFRRIDAIDFTIKLDDGAQPQNLSRADIVLIGVSRTGKTPLSIYLAQKGYKVANVPIVMGVDLPKHLFEVDHEKIFGLTINPVILQSIRKARAKALGFDGHQTNYAEIEHVKQELAHAKKIFSQIPNLPVIEVTGKAIEETAAVIVRIYHDRKQKCSMPRISKRY
ncbi:hypothetical protein HU200_051441 [Digitaria exilis]|uniref:Uncharacterized protein n=1 Tax=Digitaria exilis TaxID=1010633 RepID=A0A835E4V2_9POAL|nr:hypothetical protein HU200_051441 [Digitaria exilis]